MKTGISRGRHFWAASKIFSECRFEQKLLLEFWSSCAVRLQPRLATDLSGPFWILSSTRKTEASLTRAFELPQDSESLGMCFLRRGRKLNLNCLPQPVPISCHRIFFFRARGWTATLSLHSGWPCPGLLFHSWCPLAPAGSSSKWPRLHLVRLDYMAKSGPASHHLSGGWWSLAPAESSLKWPRLHLVRIDYMVSLVGMFFR